jgi:hypothetical protein
MLLGIEDAPTVAQPARRAWRISHMKALPSHTASRVGHEVCIDDIRSRAEPFRDGEIRQDQIYAHTSPKLL